ncbi:MAG: response regulator transcription factor [Chloroflexi bacterium]|nr:response regulator transcription factor [Chloroflexota bacterium]
MAGLIAEMVTTKQEEGAKHELMLGELNDIVEKYRDDMKTLTRILETLSTKMVVLPVEPFGHQKVEGGSHDVNQCNGNDKLLHAIKSGAIYHFGKNASTDEFVNSVKTIKDEDWAANGAFADRARMARQAMRQMKEFPFLDPFSTGLTPRETQTLRYVAEGYSNKQIARVLYVSEQTIKNHVSAVQRKLGASNRTHAVVLAARQGCIDIEEAAPEIERTAED